MTAAYGLPDHLIDPVAHAVNAAWKALDHMHPNWDEEFEGRPVHTLKALWYVRVQQGAAEGLLTPDDARELLCVVADGIEDNADRLTDVGSEYFAPDFPAALGLDLRAEEVLMTLADIANISEITA